MISAQLDIPVKEQTTAQAIRTDVFDAQNTAEVKKDIEARRNNIVIFKAPEKKEDMLEARKAADIEFITSLFQTTFGVNTEGGKIVKMFRWGKFNSEATITRPLLVTFKDYEVKESIMSK